MPWIPWPRRWWWLKGRITWRCAFARGPWNTRSPSSRIRRWRRGFMHRWRSARRRSEEHTSELQSLRHLVCRLLLEKKNQFEANTGGLEGIPVPVHEDRFIFPARLPFQEGLQQFDSLVPDFFFNDTATTEIYTLSLHDVLPISLRARKNPAQASVDSLAPGSRPKNRSEEHTSELQSLRHLVCRLLLEKKKP